MKRKGISKESEKVISESGEIKTTAKAVTMLTLKLESERRTTARDQNTVFKLRKDSKLTDSIRRTLRHTSSRDKLLEILQRTREKRIKDSQKRNALMHCYDYSCDA